MKKTISLVSALALILAIVASITLASCGGNNGTVTTAGATTAEETTAPGETDIDNDATWPSDWE